jgi:uncharacterized HAD superfamily protein
MIIGTDLDGVLCWNPEDIAEYRPWRLYQYYKESIPTKYASKKFDFIVTGRRTHFRKITLQWLAATGVVYDSLRMFPNKFPKTNKSLSEFKAYWINFLDVDIFYEDDFRIVEFLKKSCPNTEIIFVEDCTL